MTAPEKNTNSNPTEKFQASVLGIGTELTSGQIANRNGQWISQQLTQFGILTQCHLVVPDQRDLIREALKLMAKQSNLLFVTGGLGPTTDDFTRDVVAEWLELECDFHAESWERIQDIFKQRGLPLRDYQKQQCYYPKGATVLHNRMGTANGFFIQKNNLQVYVLPGPPREIAAIWEDHIHAQIEKQSLALDPWITTSWDTLGHGESEIAFRYEAALKGCTFEKGYRVHMPYVEVKLTYRKSQSAEANLWIEKVETALAGLVVSRNGEDVAKAFIHILKSYPRILISDFASKGYLFRRLGEKIADLVNKNQLRIECQDSDQVFSTPNQEIDPQDLSLFLTPTSTTSARCEIHFARQKRWCEIALSPEQKILAERAPMYFLEKAFVFWLKELQTYS